MSDLWLDGSKEHAQYERHLIQTIEQIAGQYLYKDVISVLMLFCSNTIPYPSSIEPTKTIHLSRRRRHCKNRKPIKWFRTTYYVDLENQEYLWIIQIARIGDARHLIMKGSLIQSNSYSYSYSYSYSAFEFHSRQKVTFRTAEQHNGFNYNFSPNSYQTLNLHLSFFYLQWCRLLNN